MITVKPHHFVDILTGFGESLAVPSPHPYGHAVQSVTELILSDRDVEFRMEFGVDDTGLEYIHDEISTGLRPWLLS
ncbi:MAG: hypothetical protein JXA11_07685 [Phycisphaerae bacterium]|nr:hypothetical protein [Phycisphaerae bacterium]